MLFGMYVHMFAFRIWKLVEIHMQGDPLQFNENKISYCYMHEAKTGIPPTIINNALPLVLQISNPLLFTRVFYLNV